MQTHPQLLKYLLILLLLLTGCSRYSMKDVRHAFEAGDFEKAMEKLDKGDSEKPRLPYLFERGLIAHYADRFDESNRAFSLAETTADDLYTKSISREVASLFTSDNVRPYPGTRYERLLIHYYRALNYVYLNKPDEALVECRRAGQLLQYYADQDPNYKFTGAAFIAYLSGILYEWAGEWNSAYISYRWAEESYKQYEARLGVRQPTDLGYALVRLARLLGFKDDAERYTKLYGEPPQPPPNSGELILIYESGFVPPKTEINIVFPIFKTDKFGEKGEKDAELWTFAEKVRRRQNLRYEEVELEYLLRVAIPRYTSNRPKIAGVEAQAGYVRTRGFLAEDVEAAALTTFDAEQGRILLRTIVRGLLKYLGFRKAEKKGEIAGRLVNLVNIITERADTRSWETLPNQIFLVRMPLPAGTHDLTLSFLDKRNLQVKRETLKNIEIRANGKTFLNYRTFE
jgi:uncharacterized protein